MLKKITVWLATAGFILLAFSASAQVSAPLPEDPVEFVKELKKEISKYAATKDVEKFLKQFEENWEDGAFQEYEKGIFIRLTNRMISKKYRSYPDLFNFAKLFAALKSPEAFSQIPVDDVFEVADSCISNLERKPVLAYFQFMEYFAQNGYAYKTSSSNWRFTESSPKLAFVKATLENGKEIAFPEMTFSNTDLRYWSKMDSSAILATLGKLNLMNRKFVGQRGKITWEKMQLPPEDVYCEFNAYSVNLNYGSIDIDTVTFYYNSLLNKPLKGKFEERNRGYRDINKAKYPYFGSYEGGITIENLIPNVRYQGGFSLKGIRKIGSSYYEWVDIPEPPEPVKVEEVKDNKTDEEKSFDDAFNWDDYYDYDDESVYDLPDDNETIENEEWEDEEGEEGDPEDGGEDLPEFVDPYSGKMLQKIKAQLMILRDDAVIIRLKGDEFVLDMKTLHSQNTEAILYLSGGDSIYHPNLELLYEVETDRIFLMKDFTRKMARTPFESDYHKYQLYFNAIKWDRSKDDIEFTAIIDKEHQIGAIESQDYFTKMRFKQFKGVLPFNPITAIHKYEFFNPGLDIYPDAVVQYMGVPKSLDAFLQALPDLAGSDFIEYDSKTHQIKPTEKLRVWSLAAQGKKDYDAIQILSRVESGSNAHLNVETKEIAMDGVAWFSLSDSQFVRAVPADSMVYIEGNRNLRFGGVVGAGKLDFWGIKPDMFSFEYDNYKIYCDSLDSLRFKLVRNPPPGYVFTPLQKALRKTSIEGVTGAIYINKPNNKNGLVAYPEYSIFDSYTNSYVYWAKGSIEGGVYTKDKLYFSIDPFVLDSLETFDESKLSFEGEFYSDEIFPKFRQKLTVMEDFTLGLKHITPDTGLPVFNGKGRFNNEISLDGEGLKGKGDLDFNHTLAKSDSFQFYFDSVKAVTNEFFMPGGERDGVLFPEIKASAVNYKWLTKQDVVELTSIDGAPITMFGGEGSFEGTLTITKGGVIGKGTLTMGEASVTSDQIIFQDMSIKSLDGEFKVADKSDPSKTHFLTKGVDVDYDVSKHKSTFQSRTTGVANSYFPMSQYKTSLGQGDYDRTSGAINLESSSLYKNKNFFESTAPSQDSLNFRAAKAAYNVNNQRIEVDSVPYIFVADAKVTPKGKHVTIDPSGFVQKLETCVIEADQKTKYHRIYDADVEILSRNNYKGAGKYDYRSIDGQEQFIQMTEIKVLDDTTTFAVGTIDEEQGFFLTEKIYFKGKTNLNAYNKYMKFDGAVKIKSSNSFLEDTWFPFKDVVNPDSVFVQLGDKLVDDKGNPLSVGLHFIEAYRVFYSNFLMPKKDPKKDMDVLVTGGGLTVDTKTGEFKMGPKDKLLGKVHKGAVVSYDDATNTITTEGKLEFPSRVEKNTINVDMAGSWRDEVDRKESTTNMVLRLDLGAIPKEAWAKLADKFKLVMITNEDIDFQSPLLINSLSEFIDEKGTEEKNTNALIKDLNNNVVSTDIKVANKIEKASLLFSGVNFHFDQQYKALFHTGEIGLIGINGQPINKMMNAKIEYVFGKMNKTGARMTDTLNVYVELDELTWAYFSFSGEVIETWSTDLEGYNAELSTAISKRKKEEGYRFNLASEGDRDSFQSRFVSRYIFKE